MPTGHTERATINARKPLTTGQLALLQNVAWRMKSIEDHGWPSALCWRELTTAEKNQMRSLRDRELVKTIGDDIHYRLTEAGEKALDGKPEKR